MHPVYQNQNQIHLQTVLLSIQGTGGSLPTTISELHNILDHQARHSPTSVFLVWVYLSTKQRTYVHSSSHASFLPQILAAYNVASQLPLLLCTCTAYLSTFNPLVISTSFKELTGTTPSSTCQTVPSFPTSQVFQPRYYFLSLPRQIKLALDASAIQPLEHFIGCFQHG